MSRINAIRFINLNYNYNGIRVDDETFHLGGETSLMSLRNGGGKSVLVQMIIAPLVHKRYRDTNERPFSSYFTTNKPSFILIEWKLDGEAGYVLTGMMVRKNQDIREDHNPIDLDMIQFIHEYKTPNDYDIHQIPFINIGRENKKLMNYSKCKDLLENIKSDMGHKFYLYDMNNSSSSRNYFNKLEEYQIYSKEWESIVKKVNVKESGLSELFIKAKDEAGLMKKWFLPAIEDKLNKGTNRINEFRNILNRFIKQYKDNKSKIDQKHIILLFKTETETILNIAGDLKGLISENEEIENIIANLIRRLKNLKGYIEAEKNSLIEKENLLDEEVRLIQYEELSFEIYLLQDEKKTFTDERVNVKDLIKQAEDVRLELVKNKNIQECSKIYDLYKTASRDVQEFENKLEIMKVRDKDRAPERESLGYTLKTYYKNEKNDLEISIKNLEEEINFNRKKQAELNSIIHKERATEKSLLMYLSELDTKISSYSDFESEFNDVYEENLNRNIIDEYEEGSLDLKIKNTSDLVEEQSIEIIRLKKLVEENKEKLQTLKRKTQERMDEQTINSEEIKNIEEKIAEFNSEIEERKIIIRYIGLSQDKVFFKEEILEEFKKRIDEIGTSIKDIEREIEKSEEEVEALKSGTVLKLPKTFKDKLEDEGIDYFYGMEWLKKNHKTDNENKNLIENNPFIPYSLIMTEGEINKLKSQNISVYTSFPIPIIKREDLERNFNEKTSPLYISSKVNFYVLFNDKLLDKEELHRMLLIKEEEIQSLKENLKNRREEFSLYDEKYNRIKFQKITQKDYNTLLNRLKIKERLKEEIETALKELYNDEKNLSNLQEKCLESIREYEQILSLLQRKKVDLDKLNKRYKVYLEHRREKAITDSDISHIVQKIKTINDEIKILDESYTKIEESRLDKGQNLRVNGAKLAKYSMYTKGELIQRDIEDLEARFEALTAEINSEVKDIEENLNRARSRFKVQEDDLINTSKRFLIKEEEYRGVSYDSFTLDRILNDMKEQEYKLVELNKNREKLEMDIAVIENKIDVKFKTLYSNLGKKELIGRKNIVVREFKKRVIERKDELRKNKKLQEDLNTKLAMYENNISTLSEYDNMIVSKEIDFENEIKDLDREALDRFRGELIRDYKQIEKAQIDLKADLSRELDSLMRVKDFKDDFFSRPLNTLYSLIKAPDDFIEQLKTTIKAYDDLMAKLEVDIEFIEKEKFRVIEMLLEYIKDIHRNIGKIDRNSTIKIKEKSIKMLRIETPQWEGEEYIYVNKLNTMIEHLIQSGIGRLEENENIEELISPFITTENLYNTVVGISNIDIKLYKIEAERQYSISWSDVAKNSGGEGFLSAFVVLSSLLSFMRRDETDIFSQSQEGKVLVMDNPFAQTNSSHLLMPLMEVARKNNTQLICLTGLGGESIYNCFDNIYVLNTVASSLRKGTEYLTSEHTKGEEFEQIVSSQIKVEEAEQLDFLF